MAEPRIRRQRRNVPVAFDVAGCVVVFDLDDTLYLERDFAMSGFAALDPIVEARYGVKGFGAACRKQFKAGVRGTVFNEAIKALHAEDRRIDIMKLVEAYRAHKPEIALAPDAARLLTRLRNEPTALITDGPATMQRAKIEALGLKTRIGEIIVTDELATGQGKPHHKAFEMIEQWSGRPGREHLYIADNGAKDFLAPRQRGWMTIQILREGRIHTGIAPDADHAAVLVIRSLDEIALGAWSGDPDA